MKRQVPLVAVIAPALLIVAAVGYFLLVKPEQDASGRLDDQIAELQLQVDTARVARSPAAPEAPDVTIRAADVFRLTKAMPDKDDMAGVMLELNSVASASGVEFLSITPSAPTPQTGYLAVPINLTFVGSFYDLTDFLFRLRNLVAVRDGELLAQGRLFTLDSVDLHEAPGGFPEIEAALTVTAYVYAPAPPAEAAGAETTTTPPPPPDDGAALGGS
ncbi:MAG TPA: type 4a pilus biogenesis protein PilO [Gaiellaceae bacterium]|nr:type 4a pilus biogenesis protein PilO [Gaiellaceae bacterium]